MNKLVNILKYEYRCLDTISPWRTGDLYYIDISKPHIFKPMWYTWV